MAVLLNEVKHLLLDALWLEILRKLRMTGEKFVNIELFHPKGDWDSE